MIREECNIRVYYWKRRLHALSTGEPGKGRKEASAGLLRVEVVPSGEGPISGDGRKDFEVRLRSSRSILVPRGFDPADLRQLVSTLEGC